jgi:hypothetical protein
MGAEPARSFFLLAFEHLGPLALLSMLRALPWILLAAVITFVPAASLAPALWVLLCGLLVLAGLLSAPWLGGAAQRFAAALARGEQPSLREQLATPAPHYRPLLVWALLQALLALLLLQALLPWPGSEHGLLAWLGLATGSWLWLLARLWGYVFLPLLAVRQRDLRATARLALLLWLGRPGILLPGFAVRQGVGLLLAVSGVGLLAGLGGLLPLQAALTVREALRPQGLDLAPPGHASENRPLELPSPRRLWQPWR